METYHIFDPLATIGKNLTLMFHAVSKQRPDLEPIDPITRPKNEDGATNGRDHIPWGRRRHDTIFHEGCKYDVDQTHSPRGSQEVARMETRSLGFPISRLPQRQVNQPLGDHHL